MLKTALSIVKLIASGALLRGFLIVGGIWLALNILCWVLGGIGMNRLAQKKGIAHSFYHLLPAGQICYLLRLTKKERLEKRAAFLIWWGIALFTVGIAGLVWSGVFFLREAANLLVVLLLVISALGFIGSAIFYITMRVLEFSAVFKLIKAKWKLFFAGFGIFFMIPVQRIFLYQNK
jgi:hypothetical protein